MPPNRFLIKGCGEEWETLISLSDPLYPYLLSPCPPHSTLLYFDPLVFSLRPLAQSCVGKRKEALSLGGQCHHLPPSSEQPPPPSLVTIGHWLFAQPKGWDRISSTINETQAMHLRMKRTSPTVGSAEVECSRATHVIDTPLRRWCMGPCALELFSLVLHISVI